MWSKVKDYIDKHKLLDDNKLYVVALSGGADSVALLVLLSEMRCKIEAAHCNFHLRGEESDRDESFCVELCGALGVELHRAHFDTKTYAEAHKMSIEMAARELRYSWFAQLSNDLGAAGVCVAHHRDDSVETVLMNLVRGTGLRGLCGIQPKTHVKGQVPCVILRPLLCVSRAEIEDFLAGRGQKYVTDSTNLESDVMRNKIRLQVLPLLRELNPAVSENIQRTAENLTEAQSVLDAVVSEYKGDKCLDLNALSKYRSREYIIFEWLRSYGFNGRQMEQVMGAGTGSVFTSPTGYDVLADRGRLLVEPTIKPMKPLVIPEAGTYVLDDQTRISVARETAWVSKDANVATVDASKVTFPLTVRRVEEADWMVPYGMEGRKLLSDLMTDLKMTVFEKRRQLVVVDALGTIVWSVGLRTDHRCRVDSSTVSVLCMRMSFPQNV